MALNQGGGGDLRPPDPPPVPTHTMKLSYMEAYKLPKPTDNYENKSVSYCEVKVTRE